MSAITAFGLYESALQALLGRDYAPLTGRPDLVGGDYAFEASMPFYVRIEHVGGSSDRLEGDFIFDLEVFSSSYADARSRSLALEALLLRYPHRVEVGGAKWVFDTVYQNSGPAELPWEDESVTRIGATYVLTSRRR